MSSPNNLPWYADSLSYPHTTAPTEELQGQANPEAANGPASDTTAEMMALGGVKKCLCHGLPIALPDTTPGRIC